MREELLFDTGWLFHRGDIEEREPKTKGPIYTSAKTECRLWGPAARFYRDTPEDYDRTHLFNGDKWVSVDLPHDYIVTLEPDVNENPALGFFHYQNAWYRKHFTIPREDEGKRITLLFEGVATRCTVFLNGSELKHNFCGYTSFEVDLTDFLLYGEDNVLAVYVEYYRNEGWWYQGGGIYRHVRLKKTDALAIEQWGVFLHAEKRETAWRLTAETEIRNDRFEDEAVTAETTLFDANGAAVARFSGKTTVPARSRSKTVACADVIDPHLWDTLNPYLYRAVTRLTVDGLETDSVTDRFGFRTIDFTKDGFYLNGKKTFIHGVCCHGDFGLTGKVMPDNIARYRVRLLKEMGANGFRCAHYPHSSAEMDALDEQGMLVMAETRWFSSTDEAKEQLTMLIKRDRNRPGVIMWSLGNEEPHQSTDVGKRIHKSLAALAKTLDPTRPVTAAVDAPMTSKVYDDCDLVGINYNHYHYEALNERYADKPICASECAASSTTRGWYHEDDPLRGYVCAYDHDVTKWFIGRENYMRVLTRFPRFFGYFQWAGVEHRGEAVWPRLCSQAGAIDLFLQRKDAFYQNQSIMKDEPVLHLLPHWNFAGHEGEEITVWAYTNCEETELFLNGVSCGKKKTGRLEHGAWNVPYEPGVIEAVGYRGGKELLRARRETTGRPAALRLICENESDLHAGVGDVALFTCVCLDERNREVPDAHPTVSFFSNASVGVIVGTGSDIADHTPVNALSRAMRAGRISVAVRLDHPGVLCLRAESDGLKDAQISVNAT